MNMLFKRLFSALERGHRFVTRDIWRIGKPGEKIPSGFITKNIRVAILLARVVTEETILVRASALTFATILFIVPFLVFMFSFIQTFSLGDEVYASISRRITQQLEWLEEKLPQKEPLTQTSEDSTDAVVSAPGPVATTFDSTGLDPDPAGDELATTIADLTGESIVTATGEVLPGDDPQFNEELWNAMLQWMFPSWQNQIELAGDEEYVDPVRIIVGLVEEETTLSTLGITGIIWVLVTVLGLMRNLEWSFNRIWGVKYSRNLIRTLSDYIIITFLLPFVIAGVVTVTVVLDGSNYDGFAGIALLLRLGQLSVICLTFSVVYWLVPNTKVYFKYALLGGIVSGSVWMLMSWGYFSFQVGMVRNAFFFSKLALFPMFIFWIYSSWLVLLTGALLTFAYQNERTFAMERLVGSASFAYREAVAVRVILELVRRFRQGRPGLSIKEMGVAWNVPIRLLNEIVEHLVSANLITACATEPITYQPGRAPENTRVVDVVRTVREAGVDPSQLRDDEAYGPLYKALNAGDDNYLNATVSELSERMDTEARAAAEREASSIVQLNDSTSA